MKRSGMPRRRTSLRPGGPLKRTELKRKARMGARRPVMSPAERAGRDAVEARSGGLCEGCGMRTAREWQHRKRRSQGGTWNPANGLHLCRPCHRLATVEPVAGRARGWVAWSHEVPHEVPALRRDSWVLLTVEGLVVPVLHYSGDPNRQCESVNAHYGSGGLRCALGVLHDEDHECGLVRWVYTSEERASVQRCEQEDHRADRRSVGADGRVD